jgi:hypothetical protein
MEELYRRPQLGEANKAIDANGFTDWLLCAFPSPFLRPSNHTYIHCFCEAVPNFSVSQLSRSPLGCAATGGSARGAAGSLARSIELGKVSMGIEIAHAEVLCDTSHDIPRTEQIKAALNWLDKYLGPVK